jgi:hypothetical protein
MIDEDKTASTSLPRSPQQPRLRRVLDQDIDIERDDVAARGGKPGQDGPVAGALEIKLRAVGVPREYRCC